MAGAEIDRGGRRRTQVAAGYGHRRSPGSRPLSRVDTADDRGGHVGSLDLEGADIDRSVHDAREAWTALIVGGGVGRVSGIDGGTTGQEGHGLGRAAIILERAKLRIDVEQIAGREAAAAGRIADQVVTERGEAAIQIGARRNGSIVGDDGVVDLQRAGSGGIVDAAADGSSIAAVAVTAAAGNGLVAAEGIVAQRDRACRHVQAAARTNATAAAVAAVVTAAAAVAA